MAIFSEIIAPGSYHLTGLWVANAFTAAVALCVALVIIMRARRSGAAILFFVLNAAVAGWLTCFGMMYAARTAVVALWWARAGQIPLAMIGAAGLHFALYYLGLERKYHSLALLAWVVFVNIGILAAAGSWMVRTVTYHEWGYYPAASPATTLMIATIAVATLPCLYLLWSAMRDREGRPQESAGSMLLAYLLGAVGFIDFLPAVGFEIYPVGYTAAFAFTSVAGTALWRYHLIDLTPEYAADQILQTMKSGVLLVDMDSRIRVANRAACAMLGYSPARLTGMHMRDILDDPQRMSTAEILNSSGIIEHTMAWKAGSGATIHVLASSSFVRDAKGVPIGVIYAVTDHTERRRAEEALRESETRYRTLFESNPLPMWVYDFETLRFITVNAAALRHYGYSREEFLELRITDIRPAEDVPAIMAMLPQLPDHVSPAIFRHKKKDGTLFDAEISSFEFMSEGRRRRLVIAADVTERHRAERLLRESEARYRMLFERNLAGVYRSSADGRLLDCNEACARIFGWSSREEMLQQPVSSLYFDGADRERILTQLRQDKSLSNLEVRMRRRDGSAVWVLENMTLLDNDGAGEIIEGTIVDITDRKYAQEEMEYQAYHDVLTGLPNRLLFRDRITVSLAHARRAARTVAVMFLDVDDFKNVNDSLGHTVGDHLLQEIASRLVANVRAEDTVARMGGDEFTVLLSDVGDGRGATTVAKKILEAVAEPVIIDGHELRVTTSIGVAIFPGDGFDAESLLKNADRAMYRAKQLGRNNYQYATPPPFDDRASLQRRLQEAMHHDELVLHYQPIVDIASGAVVGAEALVRWNHPVRGLLSPETFIPAAEDSELILAMGDWVLRTACAQMKEWHGGYGRLRLAVNLSPKQFQQRDLAERIADVLKDTGFPGDCLELEITESTVMQNADLSLSTMVKLKSMGVRISIDDFGTGYSSLSYLKRFPIDTLKIDQEFVRDLSGDANDQAIIIAVVSMARALKLRVIAEGVETEDQLGFLRREECREMQGFLYSRPVAAAEFGKALQHPHGVDSAQKRLL